MSLTEEVAEELEVLKSIYENDYLERPPVWNLPSFAIRLKSTDSNRNIKITGKYLCKTLLDHSKSKFEL